MTGNAVVKSVLKQADKQNAISMLDKVNLTIKERKVAEYVYFDGLTVEEIAEIMDVSTSAVAKWKKCIVLKCCQVFEMYV